MAVSKNGVNSVEGRDAWQQRNRAMGGGGLSGDNHQAERAGSSGESSWRNGGRGEESSRRLCAMRMA